MLERSRTVATWRMRPPQWGQARTSRPKLWRMSSAHAVLRGLVGLAGRRPTNGDPLCGAPRSHILRPQHAEGNHSAISPSVQTARGSPMIVQRMNVLAVVAAITAFSPATEALADHTRGSSPATDCQTWYTQPGTPHYGENGRVANEHTSAVMTLVCPVTHDNNTPSGSRTISALVRDQDPSASVSCSFYKQYMDSDSRFWHNMGATSVGGASSSFQTLSVTADLSYYWAFHSYIVCHFPHKVSGSTSALAAYLWS